MWNISDVVKATDLTQIYFGMALQAEWVSGAPAVGAIDGVLCKVYWDGAPSWPIPVANDEVDCWLTSDLIQGPQQGQQLSPLATTTTDSNGNYSLSVLPNDVTIIPSSNPISVNLGYLYNPPNEEIIITTAGVTGVNFEAYESQVIFLKANALARQDSIVTGITQPTWKYYFTKAHGSQTLKIALWNISSPGPLYLYVSKGDIPDNTDFDFSSQNPGTSDQKVLITPPSGSTVYFIGVLCVPTNIPAPMLNYTIRVTQPPQSNP
jgi:hypothetical protein